MVNTNSPHNKLPQGVAAFNGLYRRYEFNSKHKSRLFKLTKEEFKKLTLSKCFYCGSKPSKEYTNGGSMTSGAYVYNGIDRVDNTKDYILSNVVPCCEKCNYMKKTMKQDEFIKQCLKISENFSRSKT